MAALPYYGVDVPIRNSTGANGVHIFTGRARTPGDAVRIAHEVYDTARAAQASGRNIPDQRPDGWAARGIRPGWHLDWNAATAHRWT
ncbi:hypothetical protein, partial [Streptomyces tsukubensis]|uniref:hypothetical protein n=1 Tax=Streptomyces tsukubensis TaxID=83656 RepID=UPI00344EFF66